MWTTLVPFAMSINPDLATSQLPSPRIGSLPSPISTGRFLWSLWSGVHFTDFRHADGWPAPRSLLGERQGQVALSRLGGKVAPRRAAATGVQRRSDDHPRSRPHQSNPFRQTISKERFLCALWSNVHCTQFGQMPDLPATDRVIARRPSGTTPPPQSQISPHSLVPLAACSPRLFSPPGPTSRPHSQFGPNPANRPQSMSAFPNRHFLWSLWPDVQVAPFSQA